MWTKTGPKSHIVRQKAGFPVQGVWSWGKGQERGKVRKGGGKVRKTAGSGRGKGAGRVKRSSRRQRTYI